MYYRLVNGDIVAAPKSTILTNGQTIINFDLVANNYGYKELLSEPIPSYNDKCQKIIPVYDETDTHIIQKWELIYTCDLEEYRQMKIDEFDQMREAKIATRFESQGYIFSYDKKAQENFQKVTSTFTAFPERVGTQWKTLSHGVIQLTREQYFQVVLDAEKHEWALWEQYWYREHLVSQCQSYEEVDAIVW